MAPRRSRVASGSRGVISCGHPTAAQVGVAAYGDGGNAVDAAIAAAWALCVLLPDACGLGGDALFLVTKDGTTTAINGTAKAPAALPAVLPTDGGGTAGVPGAVAALCEAHTRFGRLPAERVLGPAAALAEDGFDVGPRLLAALSRHERRLAAGAAGWPLLESGLVAGDRVRFSRLASLLQAIAVDGPRVFYTGEIARGIASVAQERGGTIEASDLEAYAPEVGEPPSARFRDRVVEVSPPSSQGVLLLAALRRLEPELDGVATGERFHKQVEVLEEVFRHRDRVGGPGAADHMLSDEFIGTISIPPRHMERSGGPRGYNHTTAITAADADGLVVSALVSVFDVFGSAILVPEFEFLLNDRMLGFGEEPNAPRAGKRPVHTLAPALVRTSDAITALATPGADGQIQTLLQLLTLTTEDGVELPEALERPRWRSLDGTLLVERGFDADIVDALAERGHRVRVMDYGDTNFGAVAAVTATAEALSATSDPRREVWAEGI